MDLHEELLLILEQDFTAHEISGMSKFEIAFELQRLAGNSPAETVPVADDIRKLALDESLKDAWEKD